MEKREQATHTRRSFIVKSAIAGAALTGLCGRKLHAQETRGSASEHSSRRPNLILFVTDDQRWDAMGCMGNSLIRTPHQDRLASEGVLFTNNFCTTSICMTSRATIFTGLYARSHTINDFSLPLSESLFSNSYPMLLRKAGYRTGFVGKWGLGGPLPKEQFDMFEGFSGQGQYFHEIDGKPVHLTKIMTENATKFLHGCTPTQPFCLSVSFKAPHVKDGHPKPFRYDPAFEDLYQDVHIPAAKTASPRHFDLLPKFSRQSEGRTRWQRRFSTPEKFQESVKGYYRLITGVDEAVGRIMSLLNELGFGDNTVILFTSDNGFFLGEHGLAGKWLMHEESIRTPLIVWDPRLPKIMRGRRLDEMTLNIDIAPTLLALAGLEIPPFVEGRNLVPLLRGRSVSWRREWFYEHLYGHSGKIPMSEGIRTECWKYIRYVDQEPNYEELFDLENDPFEERDLAQISKHRTVLERMRSRHQAWLSALEAWDFDSPVPWKEPK